MNVKDRFERMMDFIEKGVTQPDMKKGYQDHASISCELSMKFAIRPRSINETFQFLTNRSLTHYIKERKMMCAYKDIIEKGSYSMNGPKGASARDYGIVIIGRS